MSINTNGTYSGLKVSRFLEMIAFLITFLGSLFYISLPANASNPNEDNTLLMIAAYKGDLREMERLLRTGANVNEQNRYGLTALMFASGGYPARPDVKKGNLDAVKLLLRSGALVNAKSNTGQTALIFATRYGKIDLVKTLLEYGADPNIAASTLTPLNFAVAKRRPDIVSLLLSHRADPNLSSPPSQPPLVTAIETIVLPNGASPENSVINAIKDTAKTIEVADIAMLLLDAGSNPNAKNINGSPSIVLATEKGNLSIVRSLLDHGAEIDAADQEGNTALIMSIRSRNFHVARLLLNRGANPNIRDHAENSPLHYARHTSPIDTGLVSAIQQKGGKE